jgi:hypothetical protein
MRELRSLPHRDRNICYGKYWRVIHSVANHHHTMTLGLERLNGCQLIRWTQASACLSNIELCRHLIYRCLLIATENLDLTAQLSQLRHCFNRIAAQLITENKLGKKAISTA